MFQRSRPEIGATAASVIHDVGIIRPPYNARWCWFVASGEQLKGRNIVGTKTGGSQSQIGRAPGINAIAGCRVEKALIINNYGKPAARFSPYVGADDGRMRRICWDGRDTRVDCSCASSVHCSSRAYMIRALFVRARIVRIASNNNK